MPETSVMSDFISVGMDVNINLQIKYLRKVLYKGMLPCVRIYHTHSTSVVKITQSSCGYACSRYEINPVGGSCCILKFRCVTEKLHIPYFRALLAVENASSEADVQGQTMLVLSFSLALCESVWQEEIWRGTEKYLEIQDPSAGANQVGGRDAAARRGEQRCVYFYRYYERMPWRTFQT